MRILRVGTLAAITAVLSLGLTSCGKNDQEAGKFERADNATFHRDMSDLSSFKLSNGITVYLQEERTQDQVAVEAVYRAGFMDEAKGDVQLSHLVEHLVMRCGVGDLKAGEAQHQLDAIQGMLSAEAVAGFTHIDYIVPGEKLGDALRIEAQRMQPLSCDNDVVTRETAQILKEIDTMVSDPKGSLYKYGMMALNQIYYHGETFVPIRGNVQQLPLKDAETFQQEHYGPEDLILVIIGNVKKANAEALVRKYFESIPSHPAPEPSRQLLTRSTNAKWDIDAQCVYYVAPTSDANFHDRLILTMFGAYLHQMLMNTKDVYDRCRSVYASNQVYRVGDIPFFIFGEPKLGHTNDDVAPVLLATFDQAVASLDDDHVNSIKSGMISFQTSSMLKPDTPDYPMAHHQVIGQEALNVALKHELREGLTVDAFDKEVNSVTPDEMRSVVKKYLDHSKLLEIRITPGR